MDNTRLFLFLGLSLVTLLLWDAWQRENEPPAPPPVAEAMLPPLAGAGGQAATPPVADVPASQPAAVAVPTTVPSPPEAGAPAVAAAAPAQPASGQRVHIKTDVLDVEVDTAGGDLRRVRLLDYPVSVTEKDKPFTLLSDQQVPYFVAQSGLLSAQGAPDHYALYRAEQTEYTLAAGTDTLRVPLTWSNDAGVKVTKVFVFNRGSHTVQVEHRVENASPSRWTGRQYRQLQRGSEAASSESSLIYTYTGGVIYSAEKKYEKYDFEDMKDADLSREITGGWAAMIQHYFLAAWLPAQDEVNHFYSKVPTENRYVLGMVSPEVGVEAGQSVVFSSGFYAGPKEQEVLENLAPGLELTVDYGWLTIIAKPLFWLLRYINELVGNWGASIALVTLLIKLAFFKLSEAGYRSMAHMRRVQPKMVAIRERYGDDRQRMSQAMMELYRKEKINPFGGCLPILVQIPVFIALYWVLLESVELRQAPFMLWIHDLSTKDPYYVLPLIMGVSMFIQQKLNPPPPDPVQAKVMMALPFVFTLFFAFFPSGLVLYWVVNNILSIAQQWFITKRVEQLDAAGKA